MLKLLPIAEENTIEFPHFPTKIHAVVFRLWNMVSCTQIARVLETSEENIRGLAKNMCLGEQEGLEPWNRKGYITIIKALWHLMPYEQILQILGWDRDRLAYILKEDDFLGIKLGGKKPACEKVFYRPFTEKEKAREKEIAKIMKKNVRNFEAVKEKSMPFDFFNLPYKPIVNVRKNEVEITSEWCMEVKKSGEELSYYIDDFRKYAYDRFGVLFSEKSDKKIVIDVEPAMNSSTTRREEDHEIIIQDDMIKITGASPVGVMRALYFLRNLTDGSGTFSFEKKSYHRKTKFQSRILYSFCGLYGDVLDQDSTISFPDELLREYAKRGINGVWIQAILYQLVPFPYDKKMSQGWEKRIENLTILIKRAQRYGIKVYLYINEPRSMPVSFFEKFPHLKGHDNKDGTACLCTSVKEVRQYVYNAFVRLVTMAPGLGGFWSICMSENLTHCYSRKEIPINCPRCAKRKAYEVAAEITSVMVNAVHSVDKNMKFFVHSWAFDDFFSKEEIRAFLNRIPKESILTAVSETGIPFRIAGRYGCVEDYSMSRVGPGEWARNLWNEAGKAGMETCAKIQVNTTWEASTAPFLPVYEKVIEHILNLSAEKTEHLFLSWTLGGYLSDNLKIASSYFFEEERDSNPDQYLAVLKEEYGVYSDAVRKAVHFFSEGFSEYPFCLSHIYLGPSNLGTANLFFEKKTGCSATMTAFPYDDTKAWSGIYSEDILIAQYEKLCSLWEKGLDEIKDMPVCEFKDMSYYSYSLFRSSLNQLRYYQLRDSGGDKRKMAEIVKEEMELAKSVYQIMVRNCCIGYEAANHYYASKTMIAEKIVQCDFMIFTH